MSLGTENMVSCFLLYFPPVLEVLDHFQSLSFQALAWPAGQGSRQFSCLGSLSKEQAIGFNSSLIFLPVTLPALCMVFLVLSNCGLEEVSPSRNSGGVELPQQNLGALFQEELESPFGFS